MRNRAPHGVDFLEIAASQFRDGPEWRLNYMPSKEYESGMDLVQIYECLCDATRLRILNLLSQGPLCVCHFQEILDEPQVKISKHLAYLRARRLVEVERQGNWMIYQLPAKPSRELTTNLACLQDCATEQALFRRDLDRLQKLDLTCTPAAALRKRGTTKRCC